MQARNKTTETATQDTPAIPRSATSLWINFTGVLCFFIGLRILREYPGLAVTPKTLLAMCGYVIPVALLEFIFLKTYAKASTGYDFSRAQSDTWKRASVKLLGFYFTLAMVGVVYYLVAEYNGGIYGYILDPAKYGGFYGAFWDLLKNAIPVLALIAIPYFFVMERYSTKIEDGNYQAGLVATLRWPEINRARLAQHALGWLVKGFFLPLMYVYVTNTVNYFTTVDVAYAFSNFQAFYDFGWEFIYGIDLMIVTVGYMLTIRILDSHIRSSEPTFSGWTWAVICYQPLWTLFYDQYFRYDSDGHNWLSLTAGHPNWHIVFGLIILSLSAVYTFASICFGLRFSNLTNRGILTNGAYRWTKHPAYVSKNLSWWFIAVPFIVHDGVTIFEAARNCALLLGVNLIYFMRARTEERHLSSDPTYVQYALAMNERSMFAWLGRIFPSLRFKPSAKLVELA